MGRRSRDREESPSAIADAVFQLPPAPLTYSLLSNPVVSAPLTEVEDRRTFHPDGPYRAARSTVTGSPARVVVKPSPFKRMLPFGLQFAQPDRVAICVRRKTRKEVLHALRRTGAGGGRRRRPVRNWYSKIGC